LQLSQITECVEVEAETVNIPWHSCGPLGVVGDARVSQAWSGGRGDRAGSQRHRTASEGDDDDGFVWD
jgi:hypothetical protein